jgi:hypothetical protein
MADIFGKHRSKDNVIQGISGQGCHHCTHHWAKDAQAHSPPWNPCLLRVRIATNRSFQLSPFLPSSYVLAVVHTSSARTFIWTLVFVIFISWSVQVIHLQIYLIHPCWQLLCCCDSKEWEEANKALRDEKDRLNKHYLDLKRTLDRLYTSEHQKLKVASTLWHAEVSSRLTLQLTLSMSA